jgi:peptide/nickel transport system substrate-binding protein
MIEAVLAARTPESYLTAIHALDRVLLSGFYVVPLFYAPDLWMARKATVKHPARLPLLGTAPETFWVEDAQ